MLNTQFFISCLCVSWQEALVSKLFTVSFSIESFSQQTTENVSSEKALVHEPEGFVVTEKGTKATIPFRKAQNLSFPKMYDGPLGRVAVSSHQVIPAGKSQKFYEHEKRKHRCYSTPNHARVKNKTCILTF